MSAYYREVKRLFANYKIVSWESMLYYFFAMLIMLMSIGGFFSLSQQTSRNEYEGILFLFMGIGGYIVSKYQSKKIDAIRFEGIFNIINSDEIDFVLVECLICEIEIYLKSIKKIAQWSVGILSTLIVLLVSFLGNTLTKFSELFFQTFDKADQQNFFKIVSNEINETKGIFFTIIIENSFWLLVFLLIPLFLGYWIFSVFTFKKKQTLLILYDMRYAFLYLNEHAEDNSSDTT